MPNEREYPKVKSLHGLTSHVIMTAMYLTGATLAAIERKVGVTLICEDGSPILYHEDELYEVDNEGIRKII